jgi:hypothetical protein
MVLESYGYGVREKRFWCKMKTLMASEIHGYGVKK